jgi:hypothetical protein
MTCADRRVMGRAPDIATKRVGAAAALPGALGQGRYSLPAGGESPLNKHSQHP